MLKPLLPLQHLNNRIKKYEFAIYVTPTHSYKNVLSHSQLQVLVLCLIHACLSLASDNLFQLRVLNSMLL